jgi:hypothetical protein
MRTPRNRYSSPSRASVCSVTNVVTSTVSAATPSATGRDRSRVRVSTSASTSRTSPPLRAAKISSDSNTATRSGLSPISRSPSTMSWLASSIGRISRSGSEVIRISNPSSTTQVAPSVASDAHAKRSERLGRKRSTRHQAPHMISCCCRNERTAQTETCSSRTAHSDAELNRNSRRLKCRLPRREYAEAAARSRSRSPRRVSVPSSCAIEVPDAASVPSRGQPTRGKTRV